MTRRKPVLKGTFGAILDDNWDELVAAFPAIQTLVEEHASAKETCQREWDTAAFTVAKLKGRRGLQGQDQGLTDLRERLDSSLRHEHAHICGVVRLLKTRYIVKIDEPPAGGWA